MTDIDKLVNLVSSILFETKQIPTEEKLMDMVRTQAKVIEFSGTFYSEEEIQAASKFVQTRHDISMGLGVLFEAEDYQPWLADRRGRIDFYFWSRYHNLLKEKLSVDVVDKLDTITDKILDHLEDPRKEGAWERKGLVVGHVQSGKTANYIGLISKATDAGYKVIIVLGGLLNSLRNQTQARIDSDFFGYCTKGKKDIGVAKFGNTRRPVSLTTSVEDFKKATADRVQIDLDALNEPVVFVLKKNVTTLKNVKKWLEESNKRGLSRYPLLLIDDEADHASINTNDADKDPTKINLGIRELLQLFPRNSYVGYTATPFANIFIDPENENEMQNGERYKDLFPRDFILSLDPPSNYVGAETVFGGENGSGSLRVIDDSEDLIPIRHKKDFIPLGLPTSLQKAIDNFVLAKTIRELRRQTGKHHSMMVNVSRFTAVQEFLKGQISEYLKARQRAVKSYAGLPEAEALRASSILRELKTVWESEYADTEFKWIDVQRGLNAAASQIAVISVNNKSADRLDYDDYPGGRSLIAIGGLGLSRGLTLEGLSISYFLRNSIMYDTLLQMGRWFGYREGYQDLCRIFMTREASSWYAHISGAVEELRGEFREMERLGLTPLEFGLKVRSHPAALIVTAKNKMRSASEFVREIALDGRFAETSRLINDERVFVDNGKVFAIAVAAADKEKQPEQMKLGWLWKGVSIEILEGVAENFKNAPDCLLTTKEPLKQYIEWLKSNKRVTTCDVLLRSLPDKGEGEKLRCAGHDVFTVKRSLEKGTLTDKRLVFMRRHITSEGDQSAGLTDDVVKNLKACSPGKDIDKECRKYRAQHQMPPLLLLIFATLKDDDGIPLIVPAYGISFPGDPSGRKRPEKTVSYTVNRTWYEQNADWADADETEDGEE